MINSFAAALADRITQRLPGGLRRRLGGLRAALRRAGVGGPDPRPAFRRGQRVDLAIIVHKDYHVWTVQRLMPALRAAGVSVLLLDITSLRRRDEGAIARAEALGLPWRPLETILQQGLRPRAVLTLNDWEPFTRRYIEAAKAMGVPTLGLVEGIQDYPDADTGRQRNAYRTVDQLILPGAFDARYFTGPAPQTHVGGMPRIDELLTTEPAFPDPPRAIINANFSYGVLTDRRDQWVAEAVAACTALGLDYRLSVHPADDGDYRAYRIGEGSIYDLIAQGSVLISRFSSAILEALAMGKPVVYYNGHGERIDKFKQPMGAYEMADTPEALQAALQRCLDAPERYRPHVPALLELHCGVTAEKSASQRTAEVLLDILRGA